jgi:hypothetical protein
MLVDPSWTNTISLYGAHLQTIQAQGEHLGHAFTPLVRVAQVTHKDKLPINESG